jgi:hypothetical protein
MKTKNIVIIDLNDCKNWNECAKIINLILSGCIKINVKQIN